MNESRQFIINASAHSIPLPDGFFHTVCTSPPYYSLRKYAGEQEVDWPDVFYHPLPGLMPPIPAMRCALGLEPTPEAYIAHLVLCFRQIWRVLRDDGVCWVVIGDSYASQGGPEPAQTKWQVEGASDGQNAGRSRAAASPLQPGDLMLIPHRLALALQGDGWIVRNDPPWAKVAPMPESVQGTRWERHQIKTERCQKSGDRKSETFAVVSGDPHKGRNPDNSRMGLNAKYEDCPGCEKCEAHGGYVLRRGSWRHTRAHETVLMLAKSMGYFSDQERVREAASDGTIQRWGTNAPERKNPSPQGLMAKGVSGESCMGVPESGRNPRSVLTPSPESYGGAHYAVFPRTLISPLLQATAPTRVCPVCGAPWCPVVERGEVISRGGSDKAKLAGSEQYGEDIGNRARRTNRAMEQRAMNIVSYHPTCDCQQWHPCPHCTQYNYSTCEYCGGTQEIPLAPVPGWVLDPFAGTFTTGEVCAELGVNCVGIDLSLDYLDNHAKPRIGLTPSSALEGLPLFEGIDV